MARAGWTGVSDPSDPQSTVPGNAPLSTNPAQRPEPLSRVSASDGEALLTLADRMMAAQRWSAALSVWNALAARNLIPYPKLNPAAGRSLTNAAFQQDPLARGFDWHLLAYPGVEALRAPSPGVIRFTFSGKQPEVCEPIRQWLPVLAGARYLFSYEYRTSGIAPESGLRWMFLDPAAGNIQIAASPHLSSDAWQAASVVFHSRPAPRCAPSGSHLPAHARPHPHPG